MLLLGGHSQVTGPELKAAILHIKPRLWKTMNHDYIFWSDIKAHLPDMKIVGRLFDIWRTHEMGDPIDAGESWADRQYSLGFFRDLVDYPEFLNEVFGYTNPASWWWMDVAQEAFVDRWKELDPTKIPIVGNCGNGNLWGEDWVSYFPLTVAKAKVFGFHSYGYPTMQTDADSWVLRYRQVMSKIREVNPNALAVITEAGITHMVIPGYPDRGYLDEQSPEQFWGTSLHWLNDRLIEDIDYMLGATIFQIGGSPVPPPEPDGWASFECLSTSIIDEMAAISPGTPPIHFKEEPVMDDLETVLANMWERQGVSVNPDDGFFKHAVYQARTNGVFIIPQPSSDGNYTTDRAGYRIAYTFPPMYCGLGDWEHVETGLPFA